MLKNHSLTLVNLKSKVASNSLYCSLILDIGRTFRYSTTLTLLRASLRHLMSCNLSWTVAPGSNSPNTAKNQVSLYWTVAGLTMLTKRLLQLLEKATLAGSSQSARILVPVMEIISLMLLSSKCPESALAYLQMNTMNMSLRSRKRLTWMKYI